MQMVLDKGFKGKARDEPEGDGGGGALKGSGRRAIKVGEGSGGRSGGVGANEGAEDKCGRW